MIGPTTVSSRVPAAVAVASAPEPSHATLASKAEFTSLSDRMSYLLALRVAMGVDRRRLVRPSAGGARPAARRRPRR